MDDALQDRVPAGFLRRTAAYTIDVVPIVLITFGYFYVFRTGFAEALSDVASNWSDLDARVRFLEMRNQVRDLSFFLWLIFTTLSESSEWQATIGKRVCGIKVIGPDGERISFLRALARSLAKILSYLPLALGFLWALFSKDKRTWHDKLTDTAVVMSNV